MEVPRYSLAERDRRWALARQITAAENVQALIAYGGPGCAGIPSTSTASKGDERRAPPAPPKSRSGTTSMEEPMNPAIANQATADDRR